MPFTAMVGLLRVLRRSPLLLGRASRLLVQMDGSSPTADARSPRYEATRKHVPDGFVALPPPSLMKDPKN